MSNSSKSAKGRQAKYRRTTFSRPRYWNINYTEKYSCGSEKDFKTIVFARSYNLALHMLEQKLKESDPLLKIKAVHGFMFHKNYHSAAIGPLGVKEWEEIRSSAFPNENNFLFKLEIPRPEGYTNRFNKTNFKMLKNIGFSKGESNWAVRNRKGKVLSIEERAHKTWKGHWVDWDPLLRQAAKHKLMEALIKSKNNRTHAAKYLGVHRNKIYKLFRKFPEVDWEKEYPAPPPPRPSSSYSDSMKKRMRDGEIPFEKGNSSDVEAKRIANMTKAKRAKRKETIEEMLPKIDSALKETGGNRTKACHLLDLSPSVFGKLLRATRGRIDWSKKYPSKFANKKYEA